MKIFSICFRYSFRVGVDVENLIDLAHSQDIKTKRGLFDKAQADPLSCLPAFRAEWETGHAPSEHIPDARYYQLKMRRRYLFKMTARLAWMKQDLPAPPSLQKLVGPIPTVLSKPGQGASRKALKARGP